MEYHEFRAMNTTIVLAAEAGPERAAAGFRAAQQAIESHERRLSRFLEDSELSRLNRSQGRWFQASPDLFEILSLAQEYFQRTGGVFDPSILPALKQAGYDRSMEFIRSAGPARESLPGGTLPAGPALALMGKADFGTLRLDRPTCRIWLPPGMEIDLGGIAKGWIAGRAAQVLAGAAGACAVNAGGDIVFHGLPHGQERWQIALEDPRDASQALAVLKVPEGAVATSTITKRTWIRDGKPQHHLIDPRRGLPAETRWLSVTVIAAHENHGAHEKHGAHKHHGAHENHAEGYFEPVADLAVAAEVYVKALLIAGPEKAEQVGWDNERFGPGEGELAFIAVDRSGKLWGSPNSKEYIDDRSDGA